MGREFASAVARWAHLADIGVRPELAVVCDTSPEVLAWYERLTPAPRLVSDYRELLADDAVEAVYCAVPHNLHEEIYTAILAAGKHLLGEKPFGIDLAANEAINRAIPHGRARPVLVGASVLPGRAGGLPLDRTSAATARCSRCARSSCTRAISTRRSRSTGSGSPRSTASTAAWVTSACTPCICRCAPAGSRATCARSSATSSPSVPAPTARPCRATPGTTPCFSARPRTTAARSRCGSRRSGSRRARRTRGRSRSTAPPARSRTRRSCRRRCGR